MNDATLNIKLPSALKEKVEKEADKKSISDASFVRMILSEYFEKKVNEK
jgi:hypothetical protein